MKKICVKAVVLAVAIAAVLAPVVALAQEDWVGWMSWTVQAGNYTAG